ncbi:unnamed protein product [Lampetra planeri]
MQPLERLLTKGPLVAKGWEWLEGRIDRLTDTVSRLVLQLTAKEARPQVLFLRLAEAALDSMVMEEIFDARHEMAVVLTIVEEEAQTLWVARCLRAQDEMNRWTQVVARVEEIPETTVCASCLDCRMTSAAGEGSLIAATVEGSGGPREEVMAAVRGWTGSSRTIPWRPRGMGAKRGDGDSTA